MEHGDFSSNGRKAQTIPSFYTEAIEQPFKSKQAGRPIFEDKEFVRIIIPGDKNSQPVYEVSDEHRERWPAAYAAFKRGSEAPLEGTPLKQWPPISASMARELAYFHILTVEQLATVGDNVIQNIGMGMRDLRRKAQVFLEVAEKGSGPLTRIVEENEQLKAAQAQSQETITALSARLEALEQAGTKGGRK